MNYRRRELVLHSLAIVRVRVYSVMELVGRERRKVFMICWGGNTR